jgi:DNA-binding NtrC family response regulator
MTSLQVDVRVVAATNRNLRAAVAARRYREELFFRLSVFPIVIPPLRERVSDIPMLARHFVERYSRDLNCKPLILSSSALEQMVAYPWPGNVRELQNCMERAVILSEGDTIHARHLSLTAHAGLAPRADDRNVWDEIDMSGSLAEVSRRMVAEVESRKIAATLKDMDGDRGRTADALQIGYKLLLEKVKDYGLGS